MVASSQPSEEVPFAPDLDEQEEEQRRRSKSATLPVIHEVIREEGEEELERSNAALAWSGLAAGLSMGFSLITEGLLRAHLPSASWTPLISKIGYSVGFLMVILGRQQLFTENTLTPVIPVLAHRKLGPLVQMLRLWAVVFVFNVVGALCVALVLGHSSLFEQYVRQTFIDLGRRALDVGFLTTFIRGIFAGWLIAFIVWLMPATQNNRFWVILLLTWVIGVGQFSHCIAGSVNTLLAVTTGNGSWGEYFVGFLIPATIGNTIGGVSLVAVLNHAQLVAGKNHQGESNNQPQSGEHDAAQPAR